MINTDHFYNNYHGHTVDHLYTLYKGLINQNPNKPFIYLAGDSSLDNKYWLKNDKGKYKLTNGYEKILHPPNARPDIAYYLNKYYSEYYTVNCAIEESSLGKRDSDLLPQDNFIKDHITENDILVVSGIVSIICVGLYSSITFL